MARKLRIQFPGAIYHVMSRGDRREDIFRDDFDRESFLQTLADTCAKTAWHVHAFCLMHNHFHLVVETPQANLVAGMKWFLGTYTARFNRRHKLSGHVFAGRYKSLLVGGNGGYLRTVCDYVHLNPVRAKLLATEESLRDYRWSSLPLLLGPTAHRPEWLRFERLFGECGIPQDSHAGRREFEQRLEIRRSQEAGDEFNELRSGWCFGDEQFRQELLAQVEAGSGPYHYGAEMHEACEAKADRIIAEELAKAVWTEAALAMRRKGDPAKLVIARRLRAETTVTLQWIASRLHMGTKTHLSHLLYWKRRAEKEDGVSPSRREGLGRKSQAPPKGKTQPRPAISEQFGEPPVKKVETRENNTIPLTDPVGGFDTSFD